MDTKEEYRKKLEEQLKEWKEKIETLETKAVHLTAGAKSQLTREIDELLQKKEVLKEKWSALQKASGEEWESMKGGLDKASAELKSALDRVASHFKKQ